MAVRSFDGTPGGGGFPVSRLVAALLWFVGCYTTWAALWAITESWEWAWLAALLVQAALTALESPVWNKRPDAVSVAALVIDAGTNVGGLYVLMTRLDRTQTWAALAQGLGLDGGISPAAALGISFALGVLLAAGPEALWKRG